MTLSPTRKPSALFTPQTFQSIASKKAKGSGLFTPDLQENVSFTKLFDPTGNIQPIYAPADLKISKRFSSICLFFISRRGGGKTLTITALAALQKKRYLLENSPYQVWSNYQIEFADFSNPRLIDFLLEEPWLARQKLICIDEIASAFPGRRSIAGINVEFSNWLTQLRKLRSECMFATQFPQVVDIQVLLQVDLFVRVHSMFKGRAVRLEVYDWWGQFTGDDSRKPWPPQPNEHDWELVLGGTDQMFGQYDTYEIVPAMYADNRDEYISRLFHEEDDDEDDGGTVVDGIEAPPADYEEWISTLPDGFGVKQMFRTAKKFLPDLESEKAWEKLLEDDGFDVDNKGNRKWAERRN